jgi:hypothetical protein
MEVAQPAYRVREDAYSTARAKETVMLNVQVFIRYLG